METEFCITFEPLRRRYTAVGRYLCHFDWALRMSGMDPALRRGGGGVCSSRSPHSGFTLIELSIVLVIIGLIIGGVLVGKELIKGAEQRSLLSELDEYRSAVNTFRLKYNCLPGDCANATQFFGTYTGAGGCPASSVAATATNQTTCNGNGNGMVWFMEVANSYNESLERLRLWQHLSAAGLTDAQYSGIGNMDGGQLAITWASSKAGWNVPKSKKEAIGINLQHSSRLSTQMSTAGGFIPALVDGHHFALGAETRVVSAAAGTVAFDIYAGIGHLGPVFSGEEAASIDGKIDDGKPLTGNVRSVGQQSNVSGIGIYCATSNSITADYRTSTFNGVSATIPICPLVIRAGF